MQVVDFRVRTYSIPIEALTHCSYASPGFYNRTLFELITSEPAGGPPTDPRQPAWYARVPEW